MGSDTRIGGRFLRAGRHMEGLVFQRYEGLVSTGNNQNWSYNCKSVIKSNENRKIHTQKIKKILGSVNKK